MMPKLLHRSVSVLLGLALLGGVSLVLLSPGCSASDTGDQAAPPPEAQGTNGEAPPAEGDTEAMAAAEQPASAEGQAATAEKPPPQPPPARSADGEPLPWTEGYDGWTLVTGYVRSDSHGGRIVATYVTPEGAAEVYEDNAEAIRLHTFERLRPYPAGTRIALTSWDVNAEGGPGRPGPLFFMRKEPPGTPWQYVFTRRDRRVLREGTADDDGVAFCAECHGRVPERDRVFATGR